MEVAPRLAYPLKTFLTTDCTGLDINPRDGLLLRTRPVYGDFMLGKVEYSDTITSRYVSINYGHVNGSGAI
jgi:electron transfer flavoprotein alpha subunit